MFLVPLPQSPSEDPAEAPVSSNLRLIARLWSIITLRLCLQFLTISSCPPFCNPWIVPVLQETQHMPQKTPQYRALSLQGLLLWFPFLLNHSKVSREISGIASDWNSCSWAWNCPCVSSICRKRTFSLGGWCEWMKCFVPSGWNNSSRKFSFLRPLLSYCTQVSSPIASH